MADENVPVTKVRLRIPRGMKVEEVLAKLEISFESVDPTGIELNKNTCCVDVSIVSPVSTIAYGGGGGDGTSMA